MNYRKTAISLPNDVFEWGEQAAAEMGLSRSELYTQALRALLRERKVVALHARLEEAYAQTPESPAAAQRAAELHRSARATIHQAIGRGESTW